MKTNYSLYNTTMKLIATKLRGIEHTDSAKHYTVISTAAYTNQFGQVNIDEVLDGMRSQLKSPMLIADIPVIEVQDGEGDNKRSNYNGGFLIVKKSTENKFELQLADIDWCIGKAQQALGYLLEKYERALEDGEPADVWRINFDSVQIIPVSKLKDNWVGVRVDMPFDIANEVSYEFNPADWIEAMSF